MQVRTPADLLIEARWLLPVLPDGVTLMDAAIAISGGRILAVGARAELAARFEPAERIVRAHHLLMPGLVNAHTHAAMTLFRALPVRTPLFAWLRDSGWPAEARWMSPDLVRDGTRLAVAEMVRAGITTFADMYFFPEEAARVAAAAAALVGGTGAHTVLRLATLGGAVALGLQHEIGSLEAGKAADLLCIDLGALDCQPVGEAAETAVFAATRGHVSDVWIAGRAFVAGGKSLAFDIDELREIAGQWRERFALEAAA